MHALGCVGMEEVVPGEEMHAHREVRCMHAQCVLHMVLAVQSLPICTCFTPAHVPWYYCTVQYYDSLQGLQYIVYR